MLEKHENQLLDNIARLNTLLTDGSYLSAYPALQGMFFGIQNGLNAISSTVLCNQRREIVHGLNQASMLYKIMTGKTVGIPDNIVLNYNPSTTVIRYPARSVVGIVDYAKQWHGLDNETLEFKFGDTTAEYNTEDNSVVVKFQDSDAYLKFENAGNDKALYHSPLLHEPMTLSMDISWMHSTFHQPVIDLLCLKEHIVDDGKKVLDELWSTPDENFQTREMPESVKQLMVLLGGHMYGKAHRGFCRYQLNGYEITLETEERWAPTHHRAPKITTVTVLAPSKNSVYQWYLNPLLVMDIRDTIEAKAEELLKIHELEMKEDQAAC